jgi:DNA-binding CsgD family transcriptional regulator
MEVLLGNVLLEKHLGSIAVLTHEGEVIYATQRLRDRWAMPLASPENPSSLPEELSFICQMLKQCRHRFPSQNWATEFDIVTKDSSTLRIRTRWVKLDGYDHPCLLLMVEDRYQMVQDIRLDEAQDWGLTAREREIWLLQQEGHTYGEIADKLVISMNTVKKHLRSVSAKRRAQVES